MSVLASVYVCPMVQLQENKNQGGETLEPQTCMACMACMALGPQISWNLEPVWLEP